MPRALDPVLDMHQRSGGTPTRFGEPTAQIRVGLNSGEVVVRAIGSDLHLDYTAVGQSLRTGGCTSGQHCSAASAFILGAIGRVLGFQGGQFAG